MKILRPFLQRDTVSDIVNEPDPRLVEQLRDLHFPTPPAGSLPAAGWWLMALVMLLFLTLLLWRWYRRYSADNTRQSHEMQAAYQRWHQHRDNARYLQDINLYLRGYALQCDGREAIARLHGESWQRWLNADSPNASSTSHAYRLSPATLQALTQECYQLQPSTQIEKVHNDISEWLSRRQSSIKSVHRNPHA